MNLAVLNPVGEIAAQEKSLMITAVSLMLVVVVPVVIMVFWFAWKYRASSVKAKYTPNWEHNTWLEVIWWGIPSIIVAVLATITWITTHKLDPYRPLDSKEKPVEIQVVALDWKWLFFYPEYNIATVNHIQIPVGKPINFRITADAPMNSFMIPQLGGQIYAMQGMETKIHLIAEKPGEFDGYSSNYSGHGFSGMHFKVNAGSEEEFQTWIQEIKEYGTSLTKELYYSNLLPPTKNNKVEYYSKFDETLFEHILKKYLMSHDMSHGKEHSNVIDSSSHHHSHHGSDYTLEEHKKDLMHVAEYYKHIGHH
jgi:cytochrome o ubiquinol oxidase subunit 2